MLELSHANLKILFLVFLPFLSTRDQSLLTFVLLILNVLSKSKYNHVCTPLSSMLGSYRYVRTYVYNLTDFG